MSEQNFNNNTNTNSNNNGTHWFSFFYRTRIKVNKGETSIINLSLIFMILAVCSAPWLAVAGLVISLALGYRFSIERNAKGFCGDFNEVVRDAAGNVKAAVDSVVNNSDEQA